jgi:hypothetical protein
LPNQWLVVSRLHSAGVTQYIKEQRESDPSYCPSTTSLYLPSKSELQRIFQFVQSQGGRPQQQGARGRLYTEEEVRQICEAYSQRRQQQQQEEEDRSAQSQSEGDRNQPVPSWELIDQRENNMDDNQQQSNAWQPSWKLRRDQSRRSSHSSRPRISPHTALSEDQSESQRAVPRRQSKSRRGIGPVSPLMTVNEYHLSLFTQRLLLAEAAYSILPAPLITADMPMEVWVPTLLTDPAFVNRGNQSGHTVKIETTPTQSQSQSAQTQTQPHYQPFGYPQQSQTQSSQSTNAPQHASSPSRAQWTPAQPIYIQPSVQSQSQSSQSTSVPTSQSTQSQMVQSSQLHHSFTFFPENSSSSSDTPHGVGGERQWRTNRSARQLSGDSSDIDLLMASIYAVTANELRTPFNSSDMNDLFHFTRPAQWKHFNKWSEGVYISWGCPGAAWPPVAKIIAADIPMANGSVLHITDQMMPPPMKTSMELKKNGTFQYMEQKYEVLGLSLI